MLGELVPCGGGMPIPLLQKRLVVGRRTECDITIESRDVSSRHCVLEFDETYWHVRDLESRNGIAVNGVRCTQTRLMPNDVVWFSRQRYSILYAVKGEPVPAPPQSAAALSPHSAAGADSTEDRGPASSVTGHTQFGRLVPCGGGDPIPLMGPQLIVGRLSNCDIQLRFKTVSSQHCRLDLKNGYWFVEDLNSTNGIKIDGVRCRSDLLKPESVLSIAGKRFQIFYTPTGEEPLPREDPFAQSLLEKAGLSKQFGEKPERKWARQDEDGPQRKKWTLDEDD